jgi:hypothetical protein
MWMFGHLLEEVLTLSLIRYFSFSDIDLHGRGSRAGLATTTQKEVRPSFLPAIQPLQFCLAIFASHLSN